MSVDLIAYGLSTQNKPHVEQFCDKVGTTLKKLDPAIPWTNRSKLYISLLKEEVRKDIMESNSTIVLWDYAIERLDIIYNAFHRPIF